MMFSDYLLNQQRKRNNKNYHLLQLQQPDGVLFTTSVATDPDDVFFVFISLMFFSSVMATYNMPVVKVKEDHRCPSMHLFKTLRGTWVESPTFVKHWQLSHRGILPQAGPEL